MDEIVTGFTAHAGGVLTSGGFVMRGDLILTTRTRPSADHGDALVEALVSYIGSDDLSAVVGSPLPLAGRTHEELHWAIVERLDTPPGDGSPVEPPADLR